MCADEVSTRQRTNREISNANLIRFKAGVSGNPAGPKPKNKYLEELLQTKLTEPDSAGKTEDELIIEALIKEAKRGSTRAAMLLWNRGYGLLTEKHQVEATYSKVELVPYGGDNVNRGSEEDVSA